MPARGRPRDAQQVASHRDAAGHRRILVARARAAARSAPRAGRPSRPTRPTRPLAATLALAASFAVAACSTLPPAALPAHADHHVAAQFIVPANGRLALPTSSPALLVQQLELDPPPRGEHFRDAVRWFDYAPGTRVEVRTRFRTWAANGAGPAR